MSWNRAARRNIVHNETRTRKTGDWGIWRRAELPHGGPGSGWLQDVRWTMANDLYAVLCRPVQTDAGEVIHCAIRTASHLEPPWRDKQRIKNELFGKERVAVEVMPPEEKLVDGADMYHIWVFPEGCKMDFCLDDWEYKI